jgi:hypothetical protein
MASGAPMTEAEGEAYHLALARVALSSSLDEARAVATEALGAWRRSAPSMVNRDLSAKLRAIVASGSGVQLECWVPSAESARLWHCLYGYPSIALGTHGEGATPDAAVDAALAARPLADGGGG